MSRRIGLPAAILAEVADRAVYGAGHDDAAPTGHAGGVVPASQACGQAPSEHMLTLVGRVFDHLTDQGAIAVSVASDIQELEQPGCLTISWSEGPSPCQVAAVFAPDAPVGALPKLPTWLALRSHTEFDLRWAQGWGAPATGDTTVTATGVLSECADECADTLDMVDAADEFLAHHHTLARAS